MRDLFFKNGKAVANCDVGDFDFLDLAIAYDEIKRHGQLDDFTRSVLVEEKITEDMAKEFCLERNAYSPHYKYSKRDGCALCFNAKPIELEIWLNDYPQAKSKLIELQETFGWIFENFLRNLQKGVDKHKKIVYNVGTRLRKDLE